MWEINGEPTSWEIGIATGEMGFKRAFAWFVLAMATLVVSLIIIGHLGW